MLGSKGNKKAMLPPYLLTHLENLSGSIFEAPSIVFA
jgi:hypothetical protein